MAPTRNTSDFLDHFRLVSWTKDSIFVRWELMDAAQAEVSGYTLRYHALGSIIVQTTQLSAQQYEYDITQLHENTKYEVCIEVLSRNMSRSLTQNCIKASTTTDSLHVALGSTFGAFLALGIIVLFVFFAKWQHTRKLNRQLQQVTPSVESFDSMVLGECEIELSDVSLQHLPDDDSSTKADVTLSMNGITNHVACEGAIFINGRRISVSTASPAAVEARKSSLATGGATPALKTVCQENEAQILPPPPSRRREGRSKHILRKQAESLSSEDKDGLAGEALITLVPPLLGTPPSTDVHKQPDVRPKDVRPKDVRPKHGQTKEARRKCMKPSEREKKDRPLVDLTNEQNAKQAHYMDVAMETGAPIRPNLSCDW